MNDDIGLNIKRALDRTNEQLEAIAEALRIIAEAAHSRAVEESEVYRRRVG